MSYLFSPNCPNFQSRHLSTSIGDICLLKILCMCETNPKDDRLGSRKGADGNEGGGVGRGGKLGCGFLYIKLKI